ncbi:Ig-like domain-containing protein [Candidatus Williamhamiltonella defendens]|uniref:Ig-like domain-containing protein n=1 Tax=Candidatus Williamhamiltonella defendens TaxID=138072 RepID=UPI001582A461|nr:Ig-like domain-containing protein [Candidatus Hamiltonella defensa]
MATQKIFAQHNSRIDLSSLGNKNQVQVAISGPDLKLTSPQGSVTIVNGAIYSSLKDSQLSFQFQDGALKGKDLLSQVNLENIDFKSADSFLVDQVQNKALQEEQEALKQKMRQAEKDKEEAEKAREKAEKEKSEAEKAALEAQEAQKSSQQIEEALNEFLTQANTKAALAQITPDERDISLDSASSLHKESSATVEVAQVNKNANRSSGLNNPAPNPKIDLKISLALDDKSNSSGQKDNLTNVNAPKLVGTTMPGTEVTIQKGSTTLGSTKSDGQGNFTFTPTDLTDGPHEFMALGEYKGNKAQAKLSLVIKSSTQPPTFEMNSEDIALTQEERSDIFLIKNVTPTIHGKAEANTQVSIYNKKITDDKETRLDTVQVNSVGEWSYTFKDPQLAQGDNTISVVAEDKAKNIAAAKKTINLDSIPPTIEKIEITQDFLISDRVANTKTPTFKITTEPDAKIQLYLPGNTQPLYIRQSEEEVADGKQAYYLTIPESTFTDDGDYKIEVVATDKRGNSTERQEFNFEVDTVEVGAVEITLEDKTGDKASNFTDKESPKLLFKPTGKNITKIEIELKSSSDGSIQKGTLEKESLSRSWTPKQKLKIEGEYTVTAKAYKGDNPGSPSSETIHFYNTQPTIQTIELGRSDQGRDPKYTKNSKPTLLVKIDPKDASRAWKVEYEIKNSKGSVENSEVTQLSNATYTVTPQTDWSHGEYTVIAKLLDKAGNSSTKNEVFYFNDTKPDPSITFAEGTDLYQIDNKKIIDNDSKKFVIKNAKGNIELHEKDLITVKLTKKMGAKTTSESFNNTDSNKDFSYHNQQKEWKFFPEEKKWEEADYQLQVTVTNQYS